MILRNYASYMTLVVMLVLLSVLCTNASSSVSEKLGAHNPVTARKAANGVKFTNEISKRKIGMDKQQQMKQSDVRRSKMKSSRLHTQPVAEQQQGGKRQLRVVEPPLFPFAKDGSKLASKNTRPATKTAVNPPGPLGNDDGGVYSFAFSGSGLFEEPTYKPTVAPGEPTQSPTTAVPTTAPTSVAPTPKPTIRPGAPTPIPTTGFPTVVPTTGTPTTAEPTLLPTVAPGEPTQSPTTAVPTTAPSSVAPTPKPTIRPGAPTPIPTTGFPTVVPTTATPTTAPTYMPTTSPTTAVPTLIPTFTPTISPTTSTPTIIPTFTPTVMPTTSEPTMPGQTNRPTPTPTKKPTSKPSFKPTRSPTQPPGELLEFATNATLSGFPEPAVNETDIFIVLNTTAVSMGTSYENLESTGTVVTEVTTRRLSSTADGGSVMVLDTSYTIDYEFEVVVSVATTDEDDADSLYEQLTTNLNESVADGSYYNTLEENAEEQGETLPASVEVESVTVGPAEVSVVGEDDDDNSSSHSKKKDNDDSDDGLSDGAIAGIVIGVLVGVALLCGLVYYFFFMQGSTGKGGLMEGLEESSMESGNRY